MFRKALFNMNVGPRSYEGGGADATKMIDEKGADGWGLQCLVRNRREPSLPAESHVWW